MPKRKKTEKPYRAGLVNSSRADGWFENLQDARRHVERIDDGMSPYRIMYNGNRILMYQVGAWYSKGRLKQ